MSNVTSSPSDDSASTTTSAPLHDSTVVSTELSLANDVNNAAVTNLATPSVSPSTEDTGPYYEPSTATGDVTETTADGLEDVDIPGEETVLDVDYDVGDSDESDEVAKTKVDAPEELKEPPLGESDSMKPSETEGPGAIQHDFPVYAYGEEEVEIVNLNRRPVSTTAKSKAVYDVKKEPTSSEELTGYNLAAEDFDPADVVNIKSDVPLLQTHEINTTYTTGVVSETNESSKISVIEVPPVLESLAPSKRILVNVTIATEPDSPNSPQSVYVLSVSLPTDGSPSPDVNVNSQSETRHRNSSHESTKNTHLTNEIRAPQEPDLQFGGECECSCPCLDPSPSPSVLTARNATDLTTEMTSLSTAETTPEDTWPTTTGTPECPESTTTGTPPTPMILILEGRTAGSIHPKAATINR